MGVGKAHDLSVQTESATFADREAEPHDLVEPVGWWYLTARGSYFAVCRRDFPTQGDVAPKAGIGSKNFHSKTTEGAHCLHTLGWKSILFV